LEIIPWEKRDVRFYSSTIDIGFKRLPEFRIVYGGSENNVSHSLLCANQNSGFLSIFNGTTIPKFFWQGEAKCTARYLESDGRAVLTQANGQVCFLRVYHGNKPISIKEIEEMYGVS
jgi:hypothetical protein